MQALPLPRPGAHDLDFAWLIKLRWVTWLGFAVLLAWARLGLAVRLPTAWVLGVLALGFGSNLAARAWQRQGGRASEASVLGLMLADTVLYTAYFFLTGGPFNPFTALYLVNVVLGALVLSRLAQWAQVIASALAFAALFVLERLAPEGLRLPNHAELMRLHLTGMLVAFAVASGFIVYFMQRLQTALRARDAELEAARKLAALTTLAAGAAHELATPLGTIAVASKELERALAAVAALPSGALEDVKLVRDQVERCRAILQGMSAGSGELAAETRSRFAVKAWLEDAAAGLPAGARVEVVAAGSLEVEGPRSAMTQALKNLVKNAVEATAPPGEVRLSARALGASVAVEVADRGCGVPAATLARVGEPFFTTREPGRGMGLGVFLARTLAEQLGGSLVFVSSEGQGTTATLSVPLRSGEARR